MIDVYYLGPEGSYSNIITKKILHTNYSFFPCKNFTEVEDNAQNNPSSLGVLPIENSITSDIHENIDFLFRSNLKIIYEAYLKINLYLIGLKNANFENITHVYSHERALAQCSQFIKKNNLQEVVTDSTSRGKDMLLQKGNLTNAIIGSREIAENDSSFVILKNNIGNDPFNLTRFVFVGNETLSKNIYARNKASIIFKVPHAPGALAKLLTSIATEGYNVTKIESRPIPGTNWEYHFWIDVEDMNREMQYEKLRSLFENETKSHTILGIYKRGELFES